MTPTQNPRPRGRPRIEPWEDVQARVVSVLAGMEDQTAPSKLWLAGQVGRHRRLLDKILPTMEAAGIITYGDGPRGARTVTLTDSTK